ncbi:MAG: hypothetical protein ABI823_06945 [Bryobacteraceae bacterium]
MIRYVLALALAVRALAGVPEDLQRIAIGQKMIVILPDGREHWGRLSRAGPVDFDLNDDASKRRITFRYDEVRKVLKGYGGHTLNGGRSHVGRARVIAIAVVGALVALAFFAATSLK